MGNKKILLFSSRFKTYGKASTSESTSFVSASGISDSTQIDAINELVNNLIGYNLWSKFYAIYPFVGGTSNSHKYNLITPIDSDAYYRLTFNGTILHSNLGINVNGAANSYINTHLYVNTSNFDNNICLGYYSQNNSSSQSTEFFTKKTNVNNPRLILHYNFGGSVFFDSFNDSTSGGRATVAISGSKGFVLGNRQSSTSSKIFHNTKIIKAITTSGGLNSEITNPLWIGAYDNSGSIIYPTSKICSLASVSLGLTDYEAVVFTKIVNLYQIRLGRKV